MRLCGFTIFVSDVKKATTFYEKLFGMTSSKKDQDSCTFVFDQVKYFIHKKETWEEGMPPNEDHVEFEVEDIEKEITKLKKEGFILESEPKEYYWGISAYLRDPEDRFIELIQK